MVKNIVFDTSVAIKWFFPENGKDKALKLKTEHLQNKINLCTRDLFLYEFTSAFKNYQPVKIEEKDFSLAAMILRSLKIKIYPLEYQELKELFGLSRKLDISIYDGSYLLLARKLNASIYTADRKLYLSGKGFVSVVAV